MADKKRIIVNTKSVYTATADREYVYVTEAVNARNGRKAH